MTDQFAAAHGAAEGARLAAVAGTAGSGPASGAPILPWPGEVVQTSVGDMFVRRGPDRAGSEPAVFVHGLGGSALNWTDLMALLGDATADPALAAEALDLPGFGFSPPPPDGDYSLDARVAAVIALIDSRGYGPVHLIGNSLGGAISTRVAARRPDLVKTLTLISPALPDLRPRPLPLRLAVVAMPGLGRWLVTKMQAMPPERRAQTSIAELYVDPNCILPERRAEAIAEMIRRDGLGYSVDALLGSARSLLTEYTRQGQGSLWADAARVTAPTLLIHGSHDRLVNPGMAGRAARTFPNCRVIVLPRIGHVAMMERPEDVATEMRDFLRRTAAATVASQDRTALGAVGR